MTTTPTVWLENFQVNTVSTNLQLSPDVTALSNGNFLVVFADSNDTVGTSAGYDIVGVIYDAEGNIVRNAFQVNTYGTGDDEEMPSIAATNDGGFIMVYEDRGANGQQILAQRYNSFGNSIDNLYLQSDPGTEFVSRPKIAVNQDDNSFFVTYLFSDGNDDSLRGNLFDSNLNVIGTPPANGRVLRSDDFSTDFVGVFNQDTDVLNNGNYVTVFQEPDGTASANYSIEFVITNGTTGANITNVNVGNTASNGVLELSPKVAALENGGFVVTWAEDESDNDNIMFALYSAGGAQIGSSTTAVDSVNNYANPDVIGLQDGGFFIAAYDSDADRIEGARYDSSGTLVGVDFFAIEATPIFIAPVLSETTDGRILVTYPDSSGDIQTEIWDPRENTLNFSGEDPGQITGRIDEDMVIIGSSNSDTISTYDGIDSIFGGNGNDRIETADGDDFIVGGNGNDTITAGLGNNSVDSGAGSDLIFIDSLGFNDVDAGAGEDFIIGGLQTDTIDGGAGNDTISYADSNNAQKINLVTSVNIGGFANNDVLSNIENVIGSNTRGDDITGTAGSNNLFGGGADDLLRGFNGDDSLFGGSANDYLFGGNGADNLFGGSGNDWAMYNALNVGVTVNLTSGLGSGGQAAGDTYSSIERVRGTNDDDFIFGNSADNKLLGGNGNDELRGLQGRDNLQGGAGNDILNGGGGNDGMRGGSGADTFIFGANSGRDYIIDFQNNIDTIQLQESIWGGGLTEQQVADTFMTQQTPGRFFFDFGGGDILFVISASPLTVSDFYDDISFI